MIWLSSLPVGTLVVGWLALALLVAVVARLAIRALVPAAEHDQVQPIAAPLMPRWALPSRSSPRSPCPARPRTYAPQRSS